VSETLPTASSSEVADVADETEFTDLTFAPPSTEPATSTDAQDDLQATASEPADERTLVADANIDDTIDDDLSDGRFTDEPFIGAQPDHAASAEPVTAAPAAAETDAIAMQVDQDLDDLTQIATANAALSAAAAQSSPITAPPTPTQPVDTTAISDDDPADFLLEAPNDNVPPPAPASDANTTRAMGSHALTTIQSELFVGMAPPDPTIPAHPAVAAKTVPVAGTLATLMAMSEEERIAAFS
jgi:hypothetical protein